RRTQGPACSLRQHEAVAQTATQRGDVGLQGLGGCARRLVAPKQLDQRVRRHYRTTPKAEHRKDGPRFGARDRDGRAALPNLERSQYPQLHRLKRSHVSHRRWGDSTLGQDRVKTRLTCDSVVPGLGTKTPAQWSAASGSAVLAVLARRTCTAAALRPRHRLTSSSAAV